MSTSNDVAQLRNHWWPRPGWQPGRIMLTWHLTFEDAYALHDHVAAYQAAIRDLPGLNLVPSQWLHLTIQGVGYVDETPADVIPRVVAAVGDALSAVSAFSLTLDRPVIFGEAIAIRPEPAEPLQRLRRALRDGIAQVLGPDAVPTGPEQAHGFRPHVSIAYASIDADSTPYRAALETINRPPIIIPITAVTLIRQQRQLAPHWLYRWTVEHRSALPS